MSSFAVETTIDAPIEKVWGALADIRFYLREEDDGKTAVTCSPDYTLKYGPVGSLMDKLMVHNTYRKGMESLLRGLKQYVEEEN